MKKITMAGIEIDQENFPELYHWSKNNPDTLRETLLALGKFHKMEDDLMSVAITLESDLEHESKVEKVREGWKLKVEQYNEKTQKDKEEILKIAKQKSMGFPWLAEAYADYFALKDGELEKYLKDKKYPAYTASASVKIIKNEKRELIKTNKIITYK